MASNANQQSGGISFVGALTLMLIGLKLGHVIDWSWWWVLLVVWLPVALVLGYGVLVVLIALVRYLAVKFLVRVYDPLTARWHDWRNRK